MPDSVTWAGLGDRAPEVAAAGRDLLYQFGVGLGYLATVRPDGGPRLHPVCPLLHEDGLYVFVVPSPKQRDLARDGRYALHSFPRDDDEDAFYVTGRATPVTDAAVRAAAAARYVAERAAFAVPEPAADHLLFELAVETALLTRTSGHGDPSPRHTVWRA